MYEQCMDLQLFIRDTEQADAWMTKQEVKLTMFIYSISRVRERTVVTAFLYHISV